MLNYEYSPENVIIRDKNDLKSKLQQGLDDIKLNKLKYKEIAKLKDVDFVEYMRKKEILFIKDDMKKIQNTKFDYSKIIVYYKRKLVDYGAIRELKNTCRTAEKYIGTIKQKENRVSA